MLRPLDNGPRSVLRSLDEIGMAGDKNITRGAVQLGLGTAEARALYDAAVLANGTHKRGSGDELNYRNAMKKLQAARLRVGPLT